MGRGGRAPEAASLATIPSRMGLVAFTPTRPGRASGHLYGHGPGFMFVHWTVTGVG